MLSSINEATLFVIDSNPPVRHQMVQVFLPHSSLSPCCFLPFPIYHHSLLIVAYLPDIGRSLFRLVLLLRLLLVHLFPPFSDVSQMSLVHLPSFSSLHTS